VPHPPAPILVLTLFGDDFRGSIVELRILALGAFGIVAMKQVGNALTARQLPTRASVGSASPSWRRSSSTSC
jgi:hypothetical protein